MSTYSILIVDDKKSAGYLLQELLKQAGYIATCVNSGKAALEVLQTSVIDLILSDLVMPEMDGVALLAEVQQLYPQLPFVVITAHGSVETAVEAMKQGAADYLRKPLIQEELLLTVRRCLESARLRQRNDRMENLLNQRFSFETVKSVSPVMGKVLESARLVATFPETTVCIVGESGTGKEVFARAIHSASGCPPETFIPVNCAAIPENLLESELFGHVKGAFTGAEKSREGKCARARGGTLFLDEIGDMPLPLQAKLLRVLEEKVYEPIGSDSSRRAEFRIIVATHRDLNTLCQQGQFRTDLYYRLNVFPLTIPPLRERKDDIPVLAEHFLAACRLHQGKPLPGLSSAAMDTLMAYDWPGNVRELRNCLEYGTIVTNGELIQPQHLGLRLSGVLCSPADDALLSLHFDFPRNEFSLDGVLARLRTWALLTCNNNKSAAARLLKTTRKFFY